MPSLTENLIIFGYLDSYAGFRLGQRYELEVEPQPDGSVHVTIPHGSPRGPMVLTA